MKKKFLVVLMTMLLLISICAITAYATDTTIPTLKIEGASLSLKNAVYINFKVNAENMTATNTKLLVWTSAPTEYKKGTEEVTLNCLGINSDGYAVFQYDNLTARDMTKTVYACAYAVVDGVAYYSEPIKYSILTYAHNMKDTADTKLKNLLDGMLTYGALAQTYFNHNTDFLATDTIYEINVNGGTLEDGFTNGLYRAGKTATLTANKAEEGYTFSHWKNSAGETVGKTKTLEVTVNGKETFEAVYIKYSVGLKYEISSDGTYYSVTDMDTCTDTDVVIPSTYNDGTNGEKDVKAIGDWAFYNRGSVTNIVIPAGVTSIGKYAFQGCTSLVSIVIPEGITSIGDLAFYHCTNLASIVIPESVTSIGTNAFENCTSLVSIKLPPEIKTISFNMFNGCSSLTSIVIPEGVTSINSNAFENCTSLVSVKLPSTIETISTDMFDSCSNLTTITIPEGVDVIDLRAFENCTNLASIIIPESLSYIYEQVFLGCTSLNNVYLMGTQDIDVAQSDNEAYFNATKYHYSETKPTTEGDFWHYNENGVPTVWTKP